MAKLVSKVYGDALMEAALEHQEVDVLFDEAKALMEVWKENPDLAVLLDNPKVVKEEKLGVLERVFCDHCSGKGQAQRNSFHPGVFHRPGKGNEKNRYGVCEQCRGIKQRTEGAGKRTAAVHDQL